MFAAAEAAAPRHPAGRADGTEGSVGQLPWVCLMKAGALVDLVWILLYRARALFAALATLVGPCMLLGGCWINCWWSSSNRVNVSTNNGSGVTLLSASRASPWARLLRSCLPHAACRAQACPGEHTMLHALPRAPQVAECGGRSRHPHTRTPRDDRSRSVRHTAPHGTTSKRTHVGVSGATRQIRTGATKSVGSTIVPGSSLSRGCFHVTPGVHIFTRVSVKRIVGIQGQALFSATQHQLLVAKLLRGAKPINTPRSTPRLHARLSKFVLIVWAPPNQHTRHST